MYFPKKKKKTQNPTKHFHNHIHSALRKSTYLGFFKSWVNSPDKSISARNENEKIYVNTASL